MFAMSKTQAFAPHISAVLLACLAAASAPALAQSRTCIIDEVNGQHRCGYLADEQGRASAASARRHQPPST
jgi:hypothetical protein